MKKTLLIFLLLSSVLIICPACQSSASITNAYDNQNGSEVIVRFIDVGQADFILIESNNEFMVIDGGNVADGQKVYSVLKKYVKNNEISYYMGTHAHEDHMGAAASVLTAVKANNIWCPNNYATQKFFKNFMKKANEQGVTTSHPEIGTTYKLGNSTFQVLGSNTPDDSNANNTSIAIRLDCGDVSFIFAGDAEYDEEKFLYNKWGKQLKSDVLKVSHHGSDSSTIYSFLKAVDPDFAVISVGKDNSYGHPTDSTLSRLRDADVKVLRTDLQGDIVFYSDGKNITYETSRNSDITTNPTAIEKSDETSKYIGNPNSKIFHSQYCSSLPSANNRIELESREQAIEKGYRACKRCRP